jgi:hypothetical protein
MGLKQSFGVRNEFTEVRKIELKAFAVKIVFVLSII